MVVRGIGETMTSSVATPLAIIGYTIGALGYMIKMSGYGFAMMAAYILILVGMIMALQQEPLEQTIKKPGSNLIAIAGYALAAITLAFASNGKNKITIFGLGLGLSLGALGYSLYAIGKLQDNSKKWVHVALTTTGSIALASYYASLTHSLFENNDTNLIFASGVCLAVYFGMTAATQINSTPHPLD